MPPITPLTERHRWPSDGYIALDDILLKLSETEPMRMEMVNIYPQKQNLGLPGPDDHPINSTWIVKSLLGGGQVIDADPNSHPDRFDWAHALTEYPGATTLPLKTEEYACPDGSNIYNPIVMGDFPLGLAAANHVAWGPDIYGWDEISGSFALVTSLANAPTREWTTYALMSSGSAGPRGKVCAFIPQGSTYEIFDGTASLVAGTAPAIDFAVWDNKLFRLDATGAIDWTLDGVTWQSAPLIAYVPDGSVPRRLIPFYDQRDEPCLYLVTDGRLFALDFDYAKLRETDLFYPRHPFQGLAAAKWRAVLYNSVGIGMHGYQPGVITPVGLDRDDSLPPEYRGYISHLEPTYNDLLALVSGTPNVGSSTETATLQLGGGDDQLYVNNVSNNALLMAWNGVGWHYRWHAPNATPTNMRASQAQDTYRLWWGAGGKVYTQFLPVTYYNPRNSEGFEYEETGYYETSWWNWGWEGQPKLAKLIELETEQCTDTETISVEYKIDFDSNDWQYLGTIDSNGEHAFLLGDDASEATKYSVEHIYRGVVHERIKLKFSFARGSDATKRPILKWHGVVCRKLLRPQRSWRVVVDLAWDDQAEQNHGEPNLELARSIEQTVLEQRAVTFITPIDEEPYVVDVVAFNLDLNLDQGTAMARINMIESQEAV